MITNKLQRHKTPSYKWNKTTQLNVFGKSELHPLWIADMELKTSSLLLDSLASRVTQAHFGYEFRPKRLKRSFIEWNKEMHNWDIDQDDIFFADSVSSSLAILIELQTKKNDSVMLFTPGFHQFYKIVKNLDRNVISLPLKETDNYYQLDFQLIEEELISNEVKLLILTNPHNPVGRVWAEEELLNLLEICEKHKIFIISDEIHRDILYKGIKIKSIQYLNSYAKQNAVTLLSPGKTFNISGLPLSVLLITNKSVRERYTEFIERYKLVHNNILSNIAFETVYSQGKEWFEEFRSLMESNYLLLDDFLKNRIPRVKLSKPEGSYLVWLDFREFNLDHNELIEIIVNKCQLAVEPGQWFGKEGRGFIRINIACHHEHILYALERLESYFGTKKVA